MNGKAISILTAAALVLGAGLWACSQAQPVSEEELSLRKADLNRPVDEPAPVYSALDPGESKPQPPAFYGAPPTIPHAIEDLVITRDANDCLDCHELGDEDTPAIPPSHRIKVHVEGFDRAKATGAQVTRAEGYYAVGRVAGNRYNCVQCHAPQDENAKLLVGNTFTPEPTDDSALRDVLEGLNRQGDF